MYPDAMETITPYSAILHIHNNTILTVIHIHNDTIPTFMCTFNVIINSIVGSKRGIENEIVSKNDNSSVRSLSVLIKKKISKPSLKKQVLVKQVNKNIIRNMT